MYVRFYTSWVADPAKKELTLGMNPYRDKYANLNPAYMQNLSGLQPDHLWQFLLYMSRDRIIMPKNLVQKGYVPIKLVDLLGYYDEAYKVGRAVLRR